jgi:hypothetical protein
MHAHTTAIVGLTMIVAALATARVDAQEPPQAGDLAKATQNPVGDLLAVPFQFNFNSGGGIPDGRTLYNFNFQPVIPGGDGVESHHAHDRS